MKDFCQAQAKAQAQLAWLALISSSTPTRHPPPPDIGQIQYWTQPIWTCIEQVKQLKLLK